MKKRRNTKLVKSRILDIFLSIVCIGGAATCIYLFVQSLNDTMVKENEEPIAVVYHKQNTAQRRFSDKNLWQNVNKSDPVYDGDRIRTGELSEAYIIFNNESRIDLNENTLIQVFEDKGSNAVEFLNGSISVTSSETKTPTEKNIVVNSGSKTISFKNNSNAIITSKKDSKETVVAVTSGSVEFSERPVEEEQTVRNAVSRARKAVSQTVSKVLPIASNVESPKEDNVKVVSKTVPAGVVALVEQPKSVSEIKTVPVEKAEENVKIAPVVKRIKKQKANAAETQKEIVEATKNVFGDSKGAEIARAVQKSEEKVQEKTAPEVKKLIEQERLEEKKKEEEIALAKEAERKAEEERLAKIAAEKKAKEEAAQKAKEEAAKKAERERLAKLEAQKKAEQERLAKLEAQRKAEEERQAKLVAEKKAKEEAERKAKEEAARKAEEERLAKIEAQKKAEQERLAKLEAEKKAEEERQAKLAAEKKAKEEAERKAKEEAAKKAEEERLAKLEAQKKAAAEKKAKEEAAKKAKEEAAKKAEKERLAKLEAQKKAAEEKKAKQEAEKKAKAEAAQKAKEDAAAKKAEETAAKKTAKSNNAAKETEKSDTSSKDTVKNVPENVKITKLKPVLKSPENGFLVTEDILIEDDAIVFKWGKMSDATKYRITIRENSSTGKKVFEKTVKTNSFKLKDDDLSCLDNGTYYWLVVGQQTVDGKTYTSHAASQSFSVHIDEIGTATIDKSTLLNMRY